MLPSVFMSANCLSNSSVTVTPATVRSFRTPTKTTPGLPYPGRSLAKAQIASRILVAAFPESDSLHSTRSDSPSFRSRIKSSFPRVVTVAPIQSAIRTTGELGAVAAVCSTSGGLLAGMPVLGVGLGYYHRLPARMSSGRQRTTAPAEHRAGVERVD